MELAAHLLAGHIKPHLYDTFKSFQFLNEMYQFMSKKQPARYAGQSHRCITQKVDVLR